MKEEEEEKGEEGEGERMRRGEGEDEERLPLGLSCSLSWVALGSGAQVLRRKKHNFTTFVFQFFLALPLCMIYYTFKILLAFVVVWMVQQNNYNFTIAVAEFFFSNAAHQSKP